MRQLGTRRPTNLCNCKKGRTSLTRRPIRQIGTRCSENLCCGKPCIWTLRADAFWPNETTLVVRRWKSLRSTDHPRIRQESTSFFLALDQTPSRREQRDHPEHAFSSGADNGVATDDPREHKPQSEWYALNGQTSEHVVVYPTLIHGWHPIMGALATISHLGDTAPCLLAVSWSGTHRARPGSSGDASRSRLAACPIALSRISILPSRLTSAR